MLMAEVIRIRRVPDAQRHRLKLHVLAASTLFDHLPIEIRGAADTRRATCHSERRLETEIRGVSVQIRLVPWRIAKPVRDLMGKQACSLLQDNPRCLRDGFRNDATIEMR
jgi:hypothetical protein